MRGKKMSGKLLAIVLVLVAVGTIFGAFPIITDATSYPNMPGVLDVTLQTQEPDEEVTFADPNLEAEIRSAISKESGPIYTSDLEGLTHLNASNRNIVDLTGLEHCTSLTHLYLRNNEISDISPLSGLTSLWELRLNNNQISDISPLSGLTNPWLLRLDNNQISDISPLSSLSSTSLVWLGLDNNQISDISPLSGLTILRMLYLDNNQISDISPLSSLTSLHDLYLNNNQIGDISPLSSLTSLRELYLEDNQISNISPLVDNAGVSEGDAVDVRDNPLSATSIYIYIPQLEVRGVEVLYTPGEWAPWVYDENKDGIIQRMEAIHAVQHYFAARITKAQAIEVVSLYPG